MKAIRIRELTSDERIKLKDGLRSPSSFTVRRSQMLLSNAKGQTAPKIAQEIHCSSQSVRRAIHAFNGEGITCIHEKSHRPHSSEFSFDQDGLERLPDIVNSSPRNYGIEHSLWSLERLARVCEQIGLTETQVSDFVMRKAVQRAGISWKRARKRLLSTDEAYEEKKNDGID